MDQEDFMNQDRSRDQDIPNRQSNMEPAEGSRENAGASERGFDNERESMTSDSSRRNSGGITNRPLDRERCEQEQLPERGHTQEER
jgi:hypothetical protein